MCDYKPARVFRTKRLHCTSAPRLKMASLARHERILSRPLVIAWSMFWVSLALRLALAYQFPLLLEEAYHWDWSRHLSAGYLEQPPLAAWITAASTTLLGTSSKIALRLPAVIFGSCAFALVFVLAHQLFRNRTIASVSMYLAIIMPLVSAVGVLALPAAALLFFHLAFLCLFVQALRSGGSLRWILAGIALGLTLLSKMCGLLTLASSIIFLLSSPPDRQWLRRKEPYFALLAALAVYAPFVWWNAQHEWATFVFHFAQTTGTVKFTKLLETSFEQLAFTTPLLLIPIAGCLMLRSSRLGEHARAFHFLKCFSLTVLGYFLILSPLIETHPHYTVLAYPTAAIAVAAVWHAHRDHRFVWGLKPLAAIQGSLLVLAALAVLRVDVISAIESRRFGDHWGGKLALGQRFLCQWDEAADHIARLFEDGNEVLFSDQYPMACKIAYHSDQRTPCELKQLLSFSDRRHTAPRYYADLGAIAESSGLFVTQKERWNYREALRHLFREVDELPPYEIRSGDCVVARYRIFRVRGLRGDLIENADLVERQMRHLHRRFGSRAYFADRGGSHEAFIIGLYRDLFRRTPTGREIQIWRDHLKRNSRSELAWRLMVSPPFWKLRRRHGEQWISQTTERANSAPPSHPTIADRPHRVSSGEVKRR
jgi:4-amino-4-deoxy-L-arabinose transferase-like glycosyltransferase